MEDDCDLLALERFGIKFPKDRISFSQMTANLPGHILWRYYKELVAEIATKVNLIYKQYLLDDCSLPPGKTLYDVIESTMSALWGQNEESRQERINKRLEDQGGIDEINHQQQQDEQQQQQQQLHQQQLQMHQRQLQIQLQHAMGNAGHLRLIDPDSEEESNPHLYLDQLHQQQVALGALNSLDAGHIATQQFLQHHQQQQQVMHHLQQHQQEQQQEHAQSHQQQVTHLSQSSHLQQHQPPLFVTTSSNVQNSGIAIPLSGRKRPALNTLLQSKPFPGVGKYQPICFLAFLLMGPPAGEKCWHKFALDYYSQPTNHQSMRGDNNSINSDSQNASIQHQLIFGPDILQQNNVNQSNNSAGFALVSTELESYQKLMTNQTAMTPTNQSQPQKRAKRDGSMGILQQPTQVLYQSNILDSEENEAVRIFHAETAARAQRLEELKLALSLFPDDEGVKMEFKQFVDSARRTSLSRELLMRAVPLQETIMNENAANIRMTNTDNISSYHHQNHHHEMHDNYPQNNR
jgi:hypothetical protein